MRISIQTLTLLAETDHEAREILRTISSSKWSRNRTVQVHTYGGGHLYWQANGSEKVKSQGLPFTAHGDART